MWSSRTKVSRRPTDLRQQFSIKSGAPTKIDFFDDKDPIKLYIGQRHSAVVTKDGSLYTFGAGSWGVLGHGNEKTLSPLTPQKVGYFAERGIKIVDCKVGEYHTVALTDKGEVYSWGYGGKKGYFSWMVSQEVGALGHGDRKPYFLPKKVEFFDTIGSKVIQISAGLYHTVALTADGEVYTWGRGLYGTLGNGSNQYSLTPQLNEDFSVLKEEGVKIVKIDSAEDYTAALTDSGEVFSFGKNDRGQMGIGTGIGIDMFESSPNPTPVTYEDGKAKVMADIYCGQSTMMLKDSEGNVWKTGLKLDYQPKMINIPDDSLFKKSVIALGCGRKHYCILNENNQLLVWGNVFKDSSDVTIDGFNMYFGDTLFSGEKCIDLSMKYGLFGVVTDDGK